MDAKDLRTESSLGERNNDGSKYSQSGGIVLHCDRNKSYQDIGSNSLSKVDVQTTRPCAVIGPDRVVVPPVTNEAYLKKAESWSSMDSTFHTRRPPEYPHKLTNYTTPTRNISPRQTFQENMQRIMVPPSYNSLKPCDDTKYTHTPDRNILPKNIKLNQPPEVKFCEVPYSVYPNSNEHNVRNSEMCLPGVNPSVTRTVPHGWPPGSVNLHSSRTYGAPDLYQYQEYSNCAGPRPVLPRPTRNISEDSGFMYSEPFSHQDGNIRFKPYPNLKQRFPHQRYEYLGNYTNTFHPPPAFHQKYEIQKSGPPHPYQPYPSMKYLDRGPETVVDGYQRTQQGSYIPFHNQVIHPNYAPVVGNCSQNKMHSYPSDSHLKPMPNKHPYDSKAYIDYDNSRAKMYNPSDNYVISEMGRMHPIKNQVVMPNYPTINVHNIPINNYYKKDNQHLKNYDYIPPHFRNMDPNLNIHNSIIRHGPMFSPTTLAISPTDSSASNDATQMLGNSQEDCGYVSQSSTVSMRSIDSGINRLPNEFLRKYYDNRFGPVMRAPMISKPELNSDNNSKEKKNLNVRQFLQMWNEGDEETEDSNTKEVAMQAGIKNDKFSKNLELITQPNQEQLYVLGLVNVPSEELGKYEHIQKVSKLPENIKGYNHIELLNQFEEAIQSSNLSNYKLPSVKHHQLPLRGSSPKQSISSVLTRPPSPLDVEAKISQSIIHKEVGCNFEIKPCSPKMLNVEIATPVQNILAERSIEKVANPLIPKPATLNNIDDAIDCNRKDSRSNILNELGRIPSCKMVNTHFSTHDTMDPIKNSYSLHDLESSSGLCLASLPRLDNDIELNFAEVNQQFINDNKGDSTSLLNTVRDLPPLDELDQSDNGHDKQNKMHLVTSENDMKTSDAVDSEKEFSKLSKYRKAKLYSPNGKDNLNATRTDSVIIKNPENFKNMEENSFSPECLKDNINVQNMAINLTSQDNSTDNTHNTIQLNSNSNTTLTPSIELQDSQENNILIDIAIDFSLSKSSSSDKIKPKLIESVNLNTKTNNSTIDDHMSEISAMSDTDNNDDTILTTMNIEVEKINSCMDSKAQVINVNEYYSTAASKDQSKKSINDNYMSLEACVKTENDVRIDSPLSTVKMMEENITPENDYLKTLDVQTNMENLNNMTERETAPLSYLCNNIESDTVSAHPLVTHKQADYYTDPEPETRMDMFLNSPCYDKLESPIQLIESKSDLVSSITTSVDCPVENIAPQKVPSPKLPYTFISENSSPLPHQSIKHSQNFDMSTDTISDKNIVTCSPRDIAILSQYTDVNLEENDSNISLSMVNSTTICHQNDIQSSNITRKDTDDKFMEHDTRIVNTFIDVENNNTCSYISHIDKENLSCIEDRVTNHDTGLNSENVSPGTVTFVDEKEAKQTHMQGLRNVLSLHKEMYSPWIQKLVMFSEGVINMQHNNNTDEYDNYTAGYLKSAIDKGISSNFSHTKDYFTDSDFLTVENKPVENLKVSVNKNYCRVKDELMTEECASVEEKMYSNSTSILKGEFHNSDNITSCLQVAGNLLLTSTSPSVATDIVINEEGQNTSLTLEHSPKQKSEETSNNDNSITDEVTYHCDIKQNIIEVPAFCKIHNKSSQMQINSNLLDLGTSCTFNDNIPSYQDIKLKCSEQIINENNPKIVSYAEINDQICSDKDISVENKEFISNENTPEPSSANSSNEKTEKEDSLIHYGEETPKLCNKSNQMLDDPSIVKENLCIEIADTDNAFKQNEKCIKTDNDFSNSYSLDPKLGNGKLDNNDEIMKQENKKNNEAKFVSEIQGIDVISALNQQNIILECQGDQKVSNTPSSEKDRKLKKENCNTEFREELNQIHSTPNDNSINQVDEPLNYGDEIINYSVIESNYPTNTLEQCNSSDIIVEQSNNQSNGKNNEQSLSTITDEFSLTKICSESYVPDKKRKPLKRSLSDSALNIMNNNEYLHETNGDDLSFLWPFKRRKYNNVDNNVLAQNLCSIIQSNRRNSVSSFYNEENVSFCILIDDSCILAEEESNGQEKICYSELSDVCMDEMQTSNNYKEKSETQVMPSTQLDLESSDSCLVQDDEETKETESWIEDVGCVETIINDDIAENVEISGPSSPKDDNVSDSDESEVISNSEHTDKVKFIYGDKMCNDDAQLVDILYNTPQMDVNKTLIHRESIISAEYYDNDSLERILSENNDKNLFSYLPEYTKPVFSPEKIVINEVQETKTMEFEKLGICWPQQTIALDANNEPLNPTDVETTTLKRTFDTNQKDLVHSNESSFDNVFTYSEDDRKENDKTSGSPEVSSTTYEDKNSTILLKITNHTGSRVSKVDNINRDTIRSSCKFTEDTDYLQTNANSTTHRPLLTKAAQKYIPPLKETMRDLKVKLSLPQHSLIKLKELKKSKEEPKLYKQNISVPKSSKKPKPKFEDVLKSIDEIQFKMHKDKAKKSKKSIPKVVIKKNENGSHYASTSSRSDFNPDMTGRKWQPWVFIEKNHFIDKMAIKRKTKAIYNHRKKTYVLAEKFKKYKAVNNAKFVITPPKSDCPSAGLKYTIRLKHNFRRS